jgi:hypothetical protein
MVALLPDAVSVKPEGNDPGLIDQAYGAVPPRTEQLAAYPVPTADGPVRGLHDNEICGF